MGSFSILGDVIALQLSRMALGSIRFGVVEGAAWMPSGARSRFGPVLDSGTVSIGAFSGYAITVSGASTRFAPGSEFDTRVIPPTSEWDGLGWINAAGGSSLKIEGPGMAVSATVAGPALQDEDSIEELACLREDGHLYNLGAQSCYPL